MTDWQREVIKRILNNPFIPVNPTSAQWRFLFTDDLEVLYGGAAGGGKSHALLMGALMFAEIPTYSALLLRKTFQDLKQPDSLIPTSRDWLSSTKARYNSTDHQWTFPSGATLAFGYLDAEGDKYQYQSAQYQYIGFDELSQFREDDYRYLLSRLRRRKGSNIPIRMRAASNPDPGWIRDRFFRGDYRFIPADLDDNPHLDRDNYRTQLDGLNPVDKARLLDGGWSAVEPGDKFRREWFEIVDEIPDRFDEVIRYWDLAGTEKGEHNNSDPDWTAGCKLGKKDDKYYVLDIIRKRISSGKVEELVKSIAKQDDVDVKVYIEQEPGQSGKSQVNYYRTQVLSAFSCHGHRPTGKKPVRADPVAAQAENGKLVLKRGSWNDDFLDEARTFPDGNHDDQVDALSGAYAQFIDDGGEKKSGFLW